VKSLRPTTATITQLRSGGYKIRDSAYMAWLHDQYRLGNLPFAYVEQPPHGHPVMELHHLANPFGGARRNLDCMVVPLNRRDHDHVERVAPKDEADWWYYYASWLYMCYTQHRAIPSWDHTRFALEQNIPTNDPREFARIIIERLAAAHEVTS
jgi:hypothetical protein